MPALKTPLMTLNLEGLPRELIETVKSKGKAHKPPLTVKWIVQLLLEAYVSGKIDPVNGTEL